MKIFYLTFLAGVALVVPLKAIDSDGTIRLYLLDHGYNHLEDDFVGKVTRYMEANRIEHIAQVDLYALPFALQDQAVPQPTAPPKGDFPPKAVHIGDVVDDALAYAKQLIPFLQTHVLNGRVQREKVYSLFLLLYKGARDTGHDADVEYFADIVTSELEKAGVCDKYGNQPIQ